MRWGVSTALVWTFGCILSEIRRYGIFFLKMFYALLWVLHDNFLLEVWTQLHKEKSWMSSMPTSRPPEILAKILNTPIEPSRMSIMSRFKILPLVKHHSRFVTTSLRLTGEPCLNSQKYTFKTELSRLLIHFQHRPIKLQFRSLRIQVLRLRKPQIGSSCCRRDF